MGLIRTIDFITRNSGRSRAWKAIDVGALCALWLLTTFSIVKWLTTLGQWTGWSAAIGILVPVALIATARGWYRVPHRRARASRSDLVPDCSEVEDSGQAPNITP